MSTPGQHERRVEAQKSVEERACLLVTTLGGRARVDREALLAAALRSAEEAAERRGVERGRAEEREACACTADMWVGTVMCAPDGPAAVSKVAGFIAAEIRARGKEVA